MKTTITTSIEDLTSGIERNLAKLKAIDGKHHIAFVKHHKKCVSNKGGGFCNCIPKVNSTSFDSKKDLINSTVFYKPQESYTIQELDKNIEDGCFGENEVLGALVDLGYYEESKEDCGTFVLSDKGKKNMVDFNKGKVSFSKKTLKRLRKHFQE